MSPQPGSGERQEECIGKLEVKCNTDTRAGKECSNPKPPGFEDRPLGNHKQESPEKKWKRVCLCLRRVPVSQNVILQDKGKRCHDGGYAPPRSVLPEPLRQHEEQPDTEDGVQVINDADGTDTLAEDRKGRRIRIKDIWRLDVPEVDVRTLAIQDRRATIRKRPLIVIERPIDRREEENCRADEHDEEHTS